jgi:hypothetical protein
VEALVGIVSKALLTWLIEKEAGLVSKTDTPHDGCAQWAMLYAEVFVGSTTSSVPLSFIGVFYDTCVGHGTGPRTAHAHVARICEGVGGNPSVR